MTTAFAHLLPSLPPAPSGDDALVQALWHRRSAAAAELTSYELPTSAEEAWRYSPVDDLDLSVYGAAEDAPSPGGGAPADLALPVQHLLVGSAEAMATARASATGGVVVVDAAALAGTTPGGAPGQAALDLLTPLLDLPLADVFASYAAAANRRTVVVVVPPGAVIEAPIVLHDVAVASGVAVPSHVVLLAGANSRATVIEWHARPTEGDLVVPLMEVSVGSGARLQLVQVQDQPTATTQIGTLRAAVARDATLEVFHAGLGGAYVRQRTDCRLVGPGATGNLSALFYGDADQVLDFRTFQVHDAPHTTSNLLFTGAVGGRAKSVYTGLIRIEKHARGSNAFQTNRNLKLSDDAWADSVPNLEIENNDVRCSHASTVSPVDPDQRFYLESRGVPTPIAERLIVEGFFAEVLHQFPVAEISSWAMERIARRLAAADLADKAATP